MNKNYTEINSKVFDKWVEEGWKWGQPINHETYVKAQDQDWFVVLTPTKPVPKEWFSEMKNAKILGLASGGGQQMPIFSALGAACTVIDYSERQLQSEKRSLNARTMPSSLFEVISQTHCLLPMNLSI